MTHPSCPPDVPLVLVGAGGLAREVVAAQRDAGRRGAVVVVDDDRTRWGTTLGGPAGPVVVGGLEEVVARHDHAVLVCVGRGSARQRLVHRLTGLGVSPDRWATLVHPTAVVPDGCVVGPGSVVLAGAVLTADVTVGRHVVLMPHVTLTHDVVVDDLATLCAGVSLGGGVRVGTAAYVGMQACVREGRSVGAGATLGMGSVLLTDQPAGTTWAGVPAAPIRAVAVASRPVTGRAS